MPSFCAVSNCELKYSHSENVSFHKFPLNGKNPKILAEWIKFTNRGSNWKPSRWNSICSRHFDKNDFREYLSRKCLKKEAIPTILTKNNISYETYHISTNSPDDTRTMHSEQDDYIPSTETFDNTKVLSEVVELCRLCGERADSLCNPLRPLDETEITLMCRKCLPGLNINNLSDQSRTICTDCVNQLKQYSEFIDKVFSYQRELGLCENHNNCTADKNDSASGNRIDCTVKPFTPNLNPVFIKQEPINVKQEKVEISNRRPFMAQIPSMSPSLCPNPFAEMKKIKVLPKSEFNSTYCQKCDRIFINNHEFRSHECTTTNENTDREQGNNCEIMEIITLNNPVSVIDLAEDENAINIEPRKPKPEGLMEYQERERLEFEHAYAKRTTSTSCNLKQEIIDTSQTGYDDIEQQTFNHGSYFDENVHIFDCTKCNESFISQELLDEHLIKSHSLQHKICSICSAEFKSTYEYLIHKNKVHTGRVQCKQCKQKFHTQSALKFHERHCTCDSKDFCISCRHCGKSQRNLAVMKKHLNHCHGKQSQLMPKMPQNDSVQKYNDRSSSSSQKNCNLSNETQTHLNKEAEKSTNEIYAIDKRSKNLGHDTNIAVKQSFKFIVDDSKFIFLNESKCMSSDQLLDTSNIGLNGRFACDTCGLPFESFAHLRQHKFDHDSERKFRCSLCPKTFKGISGLKQHISGYHYKIKPFTCSVCNYAYALKGDMHRCRHSKLRNQNLFKIV